jgi:hypothetical protein
MTDIFESPDGGHTVYRRLSGQQQRRLISGVERSSLAQQRLLWSDILIHAASDPELRYMIEQIEIYHALRYNNNHG